MVILVTRRGSGLGQEIAEAAVRAGHIVYAGVSRGADPGMPSGVRSLPLDVTNDADHEEVLSRILAEQGRLDGIVVIPSVPRDGEDTSRRFARDVIGPWRLVRRALPWLRDRPSAIVFVAPTATGASAPNRAIEALTAALRQELRGAPVRVALVTASRRRSVVRSSTAAEVLEILAPPEKAASRNATVPASPERAFSAPKPVAPRRDWAPPKPVAPRLGPVIADVPAEDLGDLLDDHWNEGIECPDDPSFDEASDLVPSQARVVADDGKVYLMDGPTLWVGRARGSDVQFPGDGRVSRRHCAIHRRERSFYVEDMVGTNGTFVDGVAITTRRLYGGETIVVGESRLRFEVIEDPVVRVALRRLGGA